MIVSCVLHYQCSSCFSKSHSAHTLSFGPSHVVQQRSTEYSANVGEIGPRGGVSGTSQVLGPASSSPAGEPARSIHRGVTCDGCNQTVVGVRHKCLDCPGMSNDSAGTFFPHRIIDYDLCTTCVESGATEQHNPFHEFFDIEIPDLGRDRDRSLGNRQQVSSPDHAQVTQQGPAATPTDPPVRHSATCNLCDSAIVGERYVSLHVAVPIFWLNYCVRNVLYVQVKPSLQL